MFGGTIGMKTTLFKAVCFSIVATSVAQAGQAAALPKPIKPIHAALMIDKADKINKPLSPIEKALSQQKRERIDNKFSLDNDPIKVMTTIQVAPTQNFFAEQHQRFSRFLQTFFVQHNS